MFKGDNKVNHLRKCCRLSYKILHFSYQKNIKIIMQMCISMRINIYNKKSADYTLTCLALMGQEKTIQNSWLCKY